jgi:hypothetical protein
MPSRPLKSRRYTILRYTGKFSPSFTCFVQVAKARETEQKIDVELKELQATLANIEQARPFDQLTVCPDLPSSFYGVIDVYRMVD